MFEKHQSPALYMANSAVLTSFAFGRPTSLVLKSGGMSTAAVPVYEGHVMRKGLTRSGLTGDEMSNLFVQTLQGAGAVLRPRPTITRRESPAGSGTYVVTDVDESKMGASRRDFWMRDLAKDMKMRCCRTSLFPHLIAVSEDYEDYTMPDGSTVSVKADLCWGLAERLFTREGEAPGSEGANAALLQESGPSAGGLEKLVLPDCVELAINKVDVDLKRELFGNIILSGGNTLWPGLPQRLGRVLGGRLPKRIKVKIHTPSTVRATPGPRGSRAPAPDPFCVPRPRVAQEVEQHYSSWIGGSILSSLGTFHQLWISKEEFAEHGAKIVDQRCA